MNQMDLVGTVVKAKAGRDSDRYFVIVDIIDDIYVHIADGSSRKLENPKKKKLKHLMLTALRFDDEFNIIIEKKITNKRLREFIKSVENR